VDEATKLAAWEDSYARRENFVFSPSDELVRFVSRHLRRRVGLDEVKDVLPGAAGARVVDIGCGIGRALTFGTQMGLEMWGIDLSERAVGVARDWLGRSLGPAARERVVAGDIRALPWADQFFDHAVSDSALDSMRFVIAQAAIVEFVRVLKPRGYFYCSLISGIGVGADPEFAGEVEVDTAHECGTVQSYFNEVKIRLLLEPRFAILGCALHTIRDAFTRKESGRWHVTAQRR
jgi:SAM-dependent methyltransferase